MVTYQDILDQVMLESGQYISDLQATLLNKIKFESLIKKELLLYSRYVPKKETRFGRLYNLKTFTMDIDGYVPEAIVDIRTDRMIPSGVSLTPMPAPVHSYHWRYEKPTLYFRYPDGDYIFSYIGNHEYKDGKIDSIDLHDRFFNLLVGRFLMTVGKSRRAFTIDEIPINTDASEMISEGKEMYDAAIEEIRENSSFQVAILV